MFRNGRCPGVGLLVLVNKKSVETPGFTLEVTCVPRVRPRAARRGTQRLRRSALRQDARNLEHFREAIGPAVHAFPECKGWKMSDLLKCMLGYGVVFAEKNK